MSLINRARKDIQIITSNLSEFGQTAVLIDTQSQQFPVNVIHTRHHNGIDLEGRSVNTLIASCAVSVSNLEGYNYTNPNGEITFKNHRIVVENVTYVIREWYPDQTAGLIVLILGLWQS
jgi:hypothetical protein